MTRQYTVFLLFCQRPYKFAVLGLETEMSIKFKEKGGQTVAAFGLWYELLKYLLSFTFFIRGNIFNPI